MFGGFQFNATNGFYVGAGVGYTASYYRHRRDFTVSEDSDFDRLGLQVRLGYRPGVRNYAPPRHGRRRPHRPRRQCRRIVRRR